MNTLVVKRHTPLAEEDKFLKTFPVMWREVDHEVKETTAILREDGSPLCYLVKRAIPRDEAVALFHAVESRITTTNNRGTATGQAVHKRVRRDGSISRTTIAETVRSSVMGFYDRYPRIPYCRETAFNSNYAAQYAATLPALVRASEVFRELVPNRWAAQKAVLDRTSPDFVIPGTVYTTVTLNKNFRTACHRDAGDLKAGFGCMIYLRSGRFTGGSLVFPSYRAAVTMESGDLVLFDPHEIHGNTEIIPLSKDYARITCVLYYREKMELCGSAEQERERAKRWGAKGFKTTSLEWREGLNEIAPPEET